MDTTAKISHLLIFIVVVVTVPASAQDSTGLWTVVAADGRGLLQDGAEFFTAPLHAEMSDWVIAGTIGAGTVACFALDKESRSIAQRNHSMLGDEVFGAGREYGREVYGLSFAAALYAGGLAFNSKDTRESGIMLLESIAFAGAVTTSVSDCSSKR